MRFCSAGGIAPGEVDETIVERFRGYRAQSGKPADDASGRRLVRTWNSNVGKIQGWPAHRLSEPAKKNLTEVPWAAFPEGFRQDVDQYLQGLTQVRRGRNGRRIRPLKSSTIKARRTELAAAARMAVKTGVAIGDLTSLSIYQATGLRMTAHQFRHAAGALILQRRPGQYELVRQLLGHRNVQTTIGAYIGLENIRASEIFSKIVMEQMDELEAAE